ncbi:hypothetical protein BDP27DRAFT_1489961 [Rhodocollybia butyracea]|uniref:Uncharacterized protein n=1 Tax=Rhodocollybia butyracea TaxID=206335 RepID=A0A9P5PFA8_9AGAR|nr:hypothetical protein BDP27DRAFT_1489961 [Rhodocollybia butyracea]
MSKLSCQSELMQNQKHADVMAPDIAFEVVQATTGEALFFSIGTDHVFYVTREVSTTATGWNRVDLSSTLSSQHGGTLIVAKSFAIAQNMKTQAFDVALTVTIAGADYLYLSLGNSSAPAAWSGGITWTSVPFDAAGITAPTPLTISDVYLMQIPSGSSSVENCFVDIIRTPGDPLKELDRYYISPSSSPHWNRHTLAIDLSSGSIQSCLGNRTADFVPGIYTFGSISGAQELIFAPQFNAFRANVPPSVSRLTLPSGATAIASALNSSGVTNLFVAAPSGLYLFATNNQGDLATPLQVINSSLFSGVSSISALTAGSRTAVWGINAQAELCYTSCPAGSEATPSSWSTPVPICTGAEGFAFYLNSQAPSNVLFVHLNGQEMIQLSQDPVTGCWSQRSILIPTTAIDDVFQYYSFTTHIQVTDANGVSAPNTPVSISVATPVSVYVNNVYYMLSPAAAVQITADATGVVTVVQETQTLQGACFHVTLSASPSTFVDVNPMSNTFQILGTIKSGNDLSSVKVTTASGTTKALLPASASADDVSAAATAISQLVQVSTTLPSNGSRQVTPTAQTMSAVKPQAASIAGIPISGGDVFQWLGDAWNNVTNFVVQEVNGFWHLVVTIAGEVYDAILDSLPAVAGAFQFVFNKLQVVWEDLVAWLGFIFEWDDIVRTHKVMKNIFRLYAQHAVSQISTLESQVQSAFSQMQNTVSGWAGLPSSGPTIGSQTSSSSPQLSGSNSPQTNWALYQAKSNFSALTTTFSPATPNTSTIDRVLDQLQAVATQEESEVVTMINQIKSEIVDNIYTLTLNEVLQKFSAIISNLFLASAETLVTALIQLLEIFLSGLVDMLDAPLEIPILSSLYKSISGDTLTFLDLFCLIGAIPATILFKLEAGNAPYPDNSATTALINATDFSTLSSLIMSGQPVPAMTTKSVVTIDLAAAKEFMPADIANICLNAGAYYGSVALAFCSALKFALEEGAIVPVPLSAACFVSYLVFVAPALSSYWATERSNWWVPMNDVVTIIAIVKTFADAVVSSLPLNPNSFFKPTEIGWWKKFSPIIELCINLSWLVADVGIFLGSQGQPADLLTYIGAVFFDIGGMLAPGTVPEWVGAELAAFIFGITEVYNIAYGGLSLEAAYAMLNQG